MDHLKAPLSDTVWYLSLQIVHDNSWNLLDEAAVEEVIDKVLSENPKEVSNLILNI